jgi:hypothetical protein
MIILAMLILSIFHPSRLLTEDVDVDIVRLDRFVDIEMIGKAL